MGVLHWAGLGAVGTAGDFVAPDHLHPLRREDPFGGRATAGVQVERGRDNAPARPESLTLLSRSVIFLP